MLLALIQNIALLIALAVCLQLLTRRLERGSAYYGVSSGLLFGAVCIIGMMTPMRFAPGVIYDGRSIVLSLAGLFGGPLSAAVAAVLSGAYRAFLGGGGAVAGVLTVIESALLGTILHYLRRRSEVWVGWVRLWLIGVLVHVVMLALQLLIPGRTGWDVLSSIGFPVLVFYPLAFLLTAQIFLEGERKQWADRALWESTRRLSKINECLLSLGTDFDANIEKLTALCGKLLGATCALYSRGEGAVLCSIGHWHTAPDNNPEDRPDGHLCHEGIHHERLEAFVVRNLAETSYAKTDPNVTKHGLRTYVIYPVKCGTEVVGSLCAFFQTDVTLGADDERVLGIVASAIGGEEARRQSEKDLRQSEEKFSSIFQHAPLLVTLSSVEDGRYLDVNEEFVRVSGFSREEAIGATSLELGWITSQDRNLIVEVLRSQGRVAGMEITLHTKDKKPIVCLYNGELITVEGKPRLLSIGQDVTQHKRAQNALRESEFKHRMLFQSLPQRIFHKDRHSVYLSCNDNYARDLGVMPEQVIGKTDYDLFPLDLAEKYRKDDQRVMESGASEEQEEPYIRNGVERWVNTVKVPICDAQGKVTGVLGIFWDITERRRAIEEKEQLQAQLSQAQRMESVGRLAGGVAHDFNNMLAVIIGHSELALTLVDSTQRVHANLQEILKAAHRSADLVRQLLAFARRQTISPRVLDLNETVEGILKMLRRLIGEDIDLLWKPGLGPWPVKADPSQIDQVLANLCVNARDAISGVGKVTIETDNVVFDEVYCREHSGFVPGEYVLLAVSDNGSGMDEGVLKNLFEPFFTTKEVGKGTGLGLATVYGIIKQNNGFINVYSEPGHGTTFKLYFPRTNIPASEERPYEREEDDLRGSETILLVEDEESILAMGKTILEQYGYVVLAAHSPSTALNLAENHPGPIHLLITDLVMPGMNGKDLKEKLCALKPGLECIFMSGYTANVVVHHGIVDEGIHFLQKPFSVKALAEKVREVLDAARARSSTPNDT